MKFITEFRGVCLFCDQAGDIWYINLSEGPPVFTKVKK